MYKLIRDKRIYMNTAIEFTAWTDMNRDTVHKIFDDGFQQFHFVVERFSRFETNSELTKLNNNAGSSISVSKELFALVSFALTLAQKTNGAFDPTIIDFLETYGYKAHYNFEKLADKKRVQTEIENIVKNRPSYSAITLNRKKHTITLAPQQRIDLGGIGKGYAIDRAYEQLLPLQNFVINAGGDIRTHGIDRTNKPWLIRLKDVGNIRLPDKAVCCSGSWARKIKFFHHLLNPHSGKPQEALQKTFVIEATAQAADGWATALFALGKKAEAFSEDNNLSAIIVHGSGKTFKHMFPKIIKPS